MWGAVVFLAGVICLMAAFRDMDKAVMAPRKKRTVQRNGTSRNGMQGRVNRPNMVHAGARASVQRGGQNRVVRNGGNADVRRTGRTAPSYRGQSYVCYPFLYVDDPEGRYVNNRAGGYADNPAGRAVRRTAQNRRPAVRVADQVYERM